MNARPCYYANDVITIAYTITDTRWHDIVRASQAVHIKLWSYSFSYSFSHSFSYSNVPVGTTNKCVRSAPQPIGATNKVCEVCATAYWCDKQVCEVCATAYWCDKQSV